jgi:hypothetical protein
MTVLTRMTVPAWRFEVKQRRCPSSAVRLASGVLDGDLRTAVAAQAAARALVDADCPT